MTAKPVILFNPRSAKSKHRVPNSILQVGASILGQRPVVFVDGNRESDPWTTLERHLTAAECACVGLTVMPGPQLEQAIPFSRRIRQRFPDVPIVWGGYFASNQYGPVLNSGYVDYVIHGPGDHAFPALLGALDEGRDVRGIPNLIFKTGDEIVKTERGPLPDYDALPRLPYDALDSVYPIEGYLGKTFMGQRTLGYHSSFGCPFTCSFCAVVPIYNAGWRGKSAEGIYRDLMYVRDRWNIDSVEFHDNNFFTSRKRVVEFSKLVAPLEMGWWGEGRIDTLDHYTDDDLALMRDAGCRMIFFGAETGSDERLSAMEKGGTQTGEQIVRFAERLGKFGIVPEYSFVLGMPAETEATVVEQIEEDIRFIRKIKSVNPSTEIIIYVYSPVPTYGSDLYEKATEAGFQFPEKLEDWLDPAWLKHDLRKNPMTPWLEPYMVDRIRDFETVLNGVFPSASDFRLSRFQKVLLRIPSWLRYKLGWYARPSEVTALLSRWKYRQPEIEGFLME